MILPDEDDTQKIKDPPVATSTIRYPERAAARRPFSPLPDYETSQALAFNGFNESQVTLYKPPPRRRFLDSRLWRAALTSLAVYIILTIVVGIPIIVTRQGEDEQKYPHNSLTLAPPWPNKNSDAYYDGNINNISSPIQSGVIPVCNNWTGVALLEETTIMQSWAQRYVSPNGQFSVTSNASYLYDFSLVQGEFYTGINPDETVQEAVISINMQSPSHSVFEQTFVCFAVAENFTNLSLYVPKNLTSNDNILFNISLLFPQSPIQSKVDTFATFLPMFDQQFGSLDDHVTFNKVTIEGPVSRVTVDSLHAAKILIDTSLEPVTGSFHASESLLISTILAPINVNVTLYNDPTSLFPTFLDMNTGNSNLTANITVLARNKAPPPRPNFIVILRTFYGSLTTRLVHDPSSPPTAIKLRAENDLGPASVTLDKLFEGLFQATTKQAAAVVNYGNANVVDPWGSGMGRSMDLDLNTTARVDGWIGWGDKPAFWSVEQQAQATVDTSLANVTLSFLG
ncbi:hypothetical protein PAXINDRAFT_166859 [Paxillus involutus ATCC 200175]|nr:hypothetical protein PAXINDRAFT_166859 [Paxillus involutus ATCC 200175]